MAIETTTDAASTLGGLAVLARGPQFVAIDKPVGLRSTPALDTSAVVSSDHKRKRQERWSEVAAHNASDEAATTLPAELASGLRKLGEEAASVPRKRQKFVRYCARSLKADDATAEALWGHLQRQLAAEEASEGLEMTDSALSRVQRAHADAHAVHRLDMETSGVLLIALDEAGAASLGGLFERKETSKVYEAVVAGSPDADEGEIALPIRPDVDRRPLQVVDHEHGKPSLTRWRVLERLADRTRLELTPVTGRTHQLRLHLQAIGFPILGDTLYAHEEARGKSDRLMLHAKRLAFTAPQSGEGYDIIAPCPF